MSLRDEGMSLVAMNEPAPVSEKYTSHGHPSPVPLCFLAHNVPLHLSQAGLLNLTVNLLPTMTNPADQRQPDMFLRAFSFGKEREAKGKKKSG